VTSVRNRKAAEAGCYQVARGHYSKEHQKLRARGSGGEELRKAGLRSFGLAVLLLGLACGTALAQVSLSIVPGCVECCPLEGLDPCPDYATSVTGRGWEPNEPLILALTGPGPAGPFGTGFFGADDEGRLEVELVFLCENPWLAEDEATAHFKGSYWWIHPDWEPADYGQWRLEVTGQAGSVAGWFLFAEDCSAAEFVPEPATLVLLGGGLLGLACYGGLRPRG
jgi:hypothetical protein